MFLVNGPGETRTHDLPRSAEAKSGGRHLQRF
jgi:hypothetical protein